MEWTLESAREDYDKWKKKQSCTNCKFFKEIEYYFNAKIFDVCEVKLIHGINTNSSINCKYFTYKN